MPRRRSAPALTPDATLEAQRLRALVDDLRAENEHLLETQRVLEASRSDFYERFELSPLPSLLVDDRGGVRSANESALALLGHLKGGLLGRLFSQFVVAADRSTFAVYLDRCLREDAAGTCELRLATSATDEQLVQLWSRRTFSPLRGLQLTLVDLRSREHVRIKNEQLLEAVQSAQKASAAKDKFIGMLSHELRTPLTPVLMAASALRHQRELPAHLRDVFAMIVRNVQIEARLVDDLLDVTRITQGKMSADRVAADLHELVRTACESFGVELLNKRQSIWIELKAEQTSVSVDLVRMQQLFGNLLSNAIKFGPTEGEIRIRSWNDASNIMIEVEDDGIGIESGNVPRIFEPFNQLEIDPSRTISGLGLGLTICRGIAELHGGRVDATSRGRGLGARFVVQLPVLEQPTAVADADGLAAAPTPAPMPPPVESSDSCRILLVEDHEDTADLLADLLADEGYEVSKVTNIREALAVDIETIDVIVSDLGLPDGSGLDLIRRLQEASSRHHPAIALSGFGTGSDVQASKEAGFDVHLTKPVDFDRLVGMIRAFDPRRRPEQFGDAQTPQLSSATPRRRN